MPAGKPMTEGKLKSLPNKAKVHLTYSHPDPSQSRHNGVAFVEQSYGFCWFHIGSPDSVFCMDFTYTDDDSAIVSDNGDDGDELEVFEYLPTRKKKR